SGDDAGEMAMAGSTGGGDTEPGISGTETTDSTGGGDTGPGISGTETIDSTVTRPPSRARRPPTAVVRIPIPSPPPGARIRRVATASSTTGRSATAVGSPRRATTTARRSPAATAI